MRPRKFDPKKSGPKKSGPRNSGPRNSSPRKFSPSRLLLALIVGGVCIGALFSAVTAVSAWREAAAPHVGDLIAFNATGVPMRGKQIEVKTRTQAYCVLDLGTLRSTGGSFSIEAVRETEGFEAHWAGPRTTVGPGDCGVSAELLLSAQQIRLLSITSQTAASGIYPGDNRT
jgi:hypothetical protein